MTGSAAIIVFGAGLRPDGTPSPTLERRILAALAFGRGLPDAFYLPTGGIGRHWPATARAGRSRRSGSSWRRVPATRSTP